MFWEFSVTKRLTVGNLCQEVVLCRLQFVSRFWCTHTKKSPVQVSVKKSGALLVVCFKLHPYVTRIK